MMIKVGFSWQLLLIVSSFGSFSRSEEHDEPKQEADPDFSLVDDMILAPEQYDILYNNVTRRNGYSQAVRLWPNAVVPFFIDNNFTTAEKSLIRAAQNIIQKESCIKFTRIKSPDETNDYVHIMPGHGCASTVGYWGGKQIIYLQKVSCMQLGRILHEFIHVLGFFHMHTSQNRDKYVDVVWTNIIPSAMLNFVSYESEVTMFGTEYDYGSITHYDTRAFSKTGSATIVSKEPDGDALMGQRTHLSSGDILRLNRMYNCA